MNEEHGVGYSVCLLTSFVALGAGCTAHDRSAPDSPRDPRAGTVDFNLTLPNGESAGTIDLHIECPGFVQDHEVPVEDGAAKASFGGLDGMCTVTLTTVTDSGTDCRGSESFTTVDGVVLPISVELTCQGYNPDQGGGVVISPEFITRSCTTDRIRKIYAVPSTLMLGSSTTVQVEVHPGSLVGTATYTFDVVNDATHVGEASLSAASGACAAGAAACRAVTCEGINGSSAIDPLTGLQVAGVFVGVTVEDADCRDTETVLVECLQNSTCGDGAVEGVEECDDSNTVNGDGCTSECDDEYCGDGVVNQNGVEQCDGTATPAGHTCSATCQFVPVCGNGWVEYPELCDDGDTLPTGVCNASCTSLAEPFCGNNIIEAGEQCDGPVLPPGAPAGSTCGPTCGFFETPSNACVNCITEGPIAEALTNDLCSATSEPLCWAVLQCYIGMAPGNGGCFANGATPAECYCGAGADTDLCATASFVPTGPCVVQMRAAKPGATNSEILDGVFGFDNLGWAGQIMLEAQGLCPSNCGF